MAQCLLASPPEADSPETQHCTLLASQHTARYIVWYSVMKGIAHCMVHRMVQYQIACCTLQGTVLNTVHHCKLSGRARRCICALLRTALATETCH